MSYENLSIERDDLIAVVTLNRPEKLNAINRALHLEMMDACKELRDDDGVRVVIFTGIRTAKPQYFVDTIYIPKGKRVAKPKTKRTKAAPRQKPASQARKPRASTPRKPALTRQQLKEQGLCRCGEPAIHEQTRCPTCAEKHRAWNRQHSENRRRANGGKPRPQIDEQFIEQVRKELAAQETGAASTAPKRVRSKANNQERAQYQQRLRSERKSLGLCVQCAEPSLKGQTRCHDCVLKHRQYELRGRVRAKITSQQ